MSIIFGIRKPMGALVSEQELLHLARATESYAPDGLVIHPVGRVGMGFQPYYTHLRSKLEAGPAYDSHGNLLTLDGRIDNYQDLCRDLQLDEMSSPDSQIILAAFVRWEEECFSRFIGDWALTLWSPKSQTLYLARDHAGTRTLYFENKGGTVLWSTYLDSFFANPRSIDVDKAYVACYLAAQPVRDLTPHKGIRSVLPAHYAIVQDANVSIKPHWSWMRTATTRYNSDNEYDEQFLALFGQSVARRDGPGAAIITELSGGMDSTSIVCMSDHNRRSRDSSAELLDTISYYDDSEPGWNEKPYFSIVEAKRGKTGIHIDTSFMDQSFEPPDPFHGLYFLPGPDSSAIERERKIQSSMKSGGYRSILSGIGGDEVLGGVPSPQPELATYLVAGDFPLLLRRSIEWCLTDRSPLFQKLFETVSHLPDFYRQPTVDKKSLPPWTPRAQQRACAKHARIGVVSGRRLGLNPNTISNGLAWWSIMETLPHTYPGFLSRPEYRYPYLDRQLVEFLFSVPRDQLLRPGRRRLLMRRALKNIVPEAILERRRKAYLVRGPIVVMRERKDKINQLFIDSILSAEGFVERGRLQTALDLAFKGDDPKWMQALIRAIALELWLKAYSSFRETECVSSIVPQLLLSETGANKIRSIRVAD
jgi:asparagine synthase (glutamine-hydrolysing)